MSRRRGRTPVAEHIDLCALQGCIFKVGYKTGEGGVKKMSRYCKHRKLLPISTRLWNHILANGCKTHVEQLATETSAFTPKIFHLVSSTANFVSVHPSKTAPKITN
jgi:hypothetical protein